jgi:hypothetical protein
MKVIYIAGKYRDKRGEYYVMQNIRKAELAALDVWELGAVAICPHKNTAFFDGARGINNDTWLKGDIEILSRCDALYLVENNWKHSEGTLEELKYARNHNIPILLTYKELTLFIYEVKRYEN